jgi:hypothetical protein
MKREGFRGSVCHWSECAVTWRSADSFKNLAFGDNAASMMVLHYPIRKSGPGNFNNLEFV